MPQPTIQKFRISDMVSSVAKGVTISKKSNHHATDNPQTGQASWTGTSLHSLSQTWYRTHCSFPGFGFFRFVSWAILPMGVIPGIVPIPSESHEAGRVAASGMGIADDEDEA